MAVEAQKEPRRGGRVATAAAGALLLGAVLVLGWALSGARGRPQVLVSSPQKPVVYVGQTGCDDARPVAAVADPATPWCTLDRALREAPDGSDVLVAPGRYAKVELDGRPDDFHSVTFRAQTAERPVLSGVLLNSVKGISFTGFDFHGGAQFLNSQDMQLVGNHFTGGGIYVKSSRRVVIAGNLVKGLRGTVRGLLAQGSANPDEPGNVDLVIRGNRFEDIEHDAIAVYNSHRRVKIIGNRISHIREPRNFPLHTDAMQLMGGTDVTIRGNVISDITHGILIKDGVASTRLKVQGNLITDSPSAGLQIFNAPGARVSHNTVWGTGVGVILANVRGVPRDRVTLTDNVFDQLLIQTRNPVRRATGNVFGRGQILGGGARVGRPRFVDSSGGDFRIRGAAQGSAPGAQLRVR